MIKLAIIVLLSVTLCHKFNTNFLEDKSGGLHHGEDYIFLKGFFNGTQLFHNLTNSDACLVVLPILHDDWVDIINLIDQLDHDEQDFFKIARAVLDKFEDMSVKLKVVEQPCSDMMKDAAHRLARLSHYFNLTWVQKMMFHGYTNVDEIRSRYRLFKTACLNHDYCTAGNALGDLTRFVFFWDFEPQMLNNLYMLIN
jgi:hypothetical protein